MYPPFNDVILIHYGNVNKSTVINTMIFSLSRTLIWDLQTVQKMTASTIQVV